MQPHKDLVPGETRLQLLPELQGHRGTKWVNKCHGTRFVKKFFSKSEPYLNMKRQHIYLCFWIFFFKKEKKRRNIFIAMGIYPCSVLFQWLRLNNLHVLQMLWLSVKYLTFPFLSPKRLLNWVELLVVKLVKLQCFVNLFILNIVYNCYFVLTAMHIICLGWLL